MAQTANKNFLIRQRQMQPSVKKFLRLDRDIDQTLFISTHNVKIIIISGIRPNTAHLFYKVIKLMQEDIRKYLRGQIAKWNAAPSANIEAINNVAAQTHILWIFYSAMNQAEQDLMINAAEKVIYVTMKNKYFAGKVRTFTPQKIPDSPDSGLCSFLQTARI